MVQSHKKISVNVFPTQDEGSHLIRHSISYKIPFRNKIVTDQLQLTPSLIHSVAF